MRKCELCKSTARMYCESDQASLCWDCDARVHSANFLVAKHSRTLLCHSCQCLTPWTGSGPKFGPTVSLCQSCFCRSNNGVDPANGHRQNDENDDEDEEDEDQEEEEGDDDDDDGDNQVVPLSSSTSLPPPLFSSTSSSSEESSSGCSDSKTRFSSSRTAENSRFLYNRPEEKIEKKIRSWKWR